jgi:hypothetical protein
VTLASPWPHPSPQQSHAPSQAWRRRHHLVARNARYAMASPNAMSIKSACMDMVVNLSDISKENRIEASANSRESPRISANKKQCQLNRVVIDYFDFSLICLDSRSFALIRGSRICLLLMSQGA